MKQNLFLDFDSTIVDSIRAYCSTYNYLYKNNEGFKSALWYEVKQYDLKDQCPLVINPQKIFAESFFFEVLEFINANTYEVIEELNEKYNIIICTIGTPKNLSKKILWLENNLPFIRNHILINNGICKMDKSIVDMKNSIFIDDNTSNLDSSNAEYKIIFGDEYEWSQTKNYKRCFNWADVSNLLK